MIVTVRVCTDVEWFYITVVAVARAFIDGGHFSRDQKALNYDKNW